MAPVLMESQYKMYKSICRVYESTCRYDSRGWQWMVGRIIFKIGFFVFSDVSENLPLSAPELLP